jgi:hypothetical protein
MPHTDNLLGFATVASFGMIAAVAVQPWSHASATAAPGSTAAPTMRMVQLPPVDVVARRSVESARIEREDRLRCVQAPAQPKA